MKIAILPLAFVAVLQCYSVTVFGDGPPPPLTDVALKKAVEEAVGTPVAEAMKDLYQALIRERAPKVLRRMRYMLAGAFGKSDPLDLAKFIMDKLKAEVFKGRVNEKMWKSLTMELYFALKEWWSVTPENPKDAADLGAWHSLVNVYKEVMAPALRGSDNVGTMNNILLDPELENIRKWIAEWKGVALAKPRAAATPQPEDQETEAEKE